MTNNNLRIHNIHALGRAAPALPCLVANCGCRFHNKTGRTHHMRSRHPDFVSDAGPSVLSAHMPQADVPPPHQSSPHNSPIHRHRSPSNHQDSLSSGSHQHSTPEPMHTPSRSPSNSGHNDNAGEDEINMDSGHPSQIETGDIVYLHALLEANPALYLDKLQTCLLSVWNINLSIATIS
jgi:hypothetical protein